jgi:class 3 adenylate cyclase
MVGFSIMSQKFPVEEVTAVVNAYLDVCCQRIVQHGGEVTKYIGDCVMAHFPPDYADAAIEACLEALDDVRRLRRVAGQCQPMNLLYCGFCRWRRKSVFRWRSCELGGVPRLPRR